MSDPNSQAHLDLYEKTQLGERFSAKDRKIYLPRLERECVETYFKNKQAPLLEGGCGSGRLSFALEAEGYTQITAFDFARNLLEDANRVATERHSRIKFLQADATRLEQFPAATFEHIFYGAHLISIIPMPQRIAALREVARILRPGGVGVLTALSRNYSFGRRAMLRAYALRNLLFAKNFSAAELPYLRLGRKINWKGCLCGGPTVTWFTPEELIALVEACGLRVLHCTDTTGLQGGQRDLTIVLACTRADSPS